VNIIDPIDLVPKMPSEPDEVELCRISNRKDLLRCLDKFKSLYKVEKRAFYFAESILLLCYHYFMTYRSYSTSLFLKNTDASTKQGYAFIFDKESRQIHSVDDYNIYETSRYKVVKSNVTHVLDEKYKFDMTRRVTSNKMMYFSHWDLINLELNRFYPFRMKALGRKKLILISGDEIRKLTDTSLECLLIVDTNFNFDSRKLRKNLLFDHYELRLFVEARTSRNLKPGRYIDVVYIDDINAVTSILENKMNDLASSMVYTAKFF